MLSIKPLTPAFAVAPRPAKGDIVGIAGAGFATIINFQLDCENKDLGARAEVRRAAEAAGLTYVHIPAAKHELFTDAVIERAARTLKTAPGPVLAHCASGQRAAIIWAAASARSQPVDEVLGILKAAGFDLDFLRDDLEAQADRARWTSGNECGLTADLADQALEAA